MPLSICIICFVTSYPFIFWCSPTTESLSLGNMATRCLQYSQNNFIEMYVHLDCLSAIFVILNKVTLNGLAAPGLVGSSV